MSQLLEEIKQIPQNEFEQLFESQDDIVRTVDTDIGEYRFVLIFVGEGHNLRMGDGKYELRITADLEDSSDIPEAKDVLYNVCDYIFSRRDVGVYQDYPTHRAKVSSEFMTEDEIRDGFNV